MSNSEMESHSRSWEKLLRLAPEQAGEAIAQAIERRTKRLLIGNDAKQANFIQRLLPVSYWRVISARTAP